MQTGPLQDASLIKGQRLKIKKTLKKKRKEVRYWEVVRGGWGRMGEKVRG